MQSMKLVAKLHTINQTDKYFMLKNIKCEKLECLLLFSVDVCFSNPQKNSIIFCRVIKAVYIIYICTKKYFVKIYKNICMFKINAYLCIRFTNLN